MGDEMARVVTVLSDLGQGQVSNSKFCTLDTQTNTCSLEKDTCIRAISKILEKILKHTRNNV